MVSWLPLTVILSAVTAIVSTSELSDTFLITISPTVPFLMSSLKLTTKSAPTAIFVASSAGVKLLATGGVVSKDVVVFFYSLEMEWPEFSKPVNRKSGLPSPS